MLNVCQGRSFSELLTILICVLRPVNIFQLWNADETNFSLFQLCMPTWLSTTQWPCQLLPTWNPEQQDRSDWPLSVPAVSSTLCLSARCQSTLWAYAFYNSHDPIFFICTVSVMYSDSTAHSPTQALVASRDLHSPALLVITARLAPCSPPNTSVQQAPGMIAVGWSLRASAGHAHEAGIVWLV